MSMTSMRNRFIALVVGTLVLLVGTYALAYKPSKTKLANVRADVTRSQQEVVQLTTKLQALQQLKKDAKSLRAQQAKFQHALPTDPAVSKFILDVQDAADQAGIDFLSVAPSLPAASAAAAPAPAPTTTSASPAPSASPSTTETAPPAPAAASPLQSISVSISATGKFFAIEDFVAKMEKLPRALRVGTFGLTPGQEGSLSLSISLQIFSMAAPAAPTTTAPSTTTTSSGA